MSGNINTFQIKPLTRDCCGFDVDANEDGCSIVSCDCGICTNNIKEQLGYLDKELSKYVEYHRTWNENDAMQDYTTLCNIRDKIKDIIKGVEVYTT